MKAIKVIGILAFLACQGALATEELCFEISYPGSGNYVALSNNRGIHTRLWCENPWILDHTFINYIVTSHPYPEKDEIFSIQYEQECKDIVRNMEAAFNSNPSRPDSIYWFTVDRDSKKVTHLRRENGNQCPRPADATQVDLTP